jgi:hypothetical protein
LETEKQNSKSLSIVELVAQSGLYKYFEISGIRPDSLMIMLSGFYPSDIYCVDCKSMSVFKGAEPIAPKMVMVGAPSMGRLVRNLGEIPKEPEHMDQDYTLDLVCSRNFTHRIKAVFRINQNTLTKIGQFPSVADLQLNQLSKYDGVLADNLRKDFGRAIGLNAHGIGIGAFVYLRRIFENLIEEAHQEITKLNDWDEDAYQRAKTDERIKLLKSLLPEILVSNAAIYSILSKGIHILSDDECLEYYDTIKMGIELILDEKIRQQQEDQTKKHLSAEINRIHSKLK